LSSSKFELAAPFVNYMSILTIHTFWDVALFLRLRAGWFTRKHAKGFLRAFGHGTAMPVSART
jgi:hypothetical protein